MSYLERRLNLASLVQPTLDGSDKAFSGKMEGDTQYFENNIAKYRHSFNLWKSYNLQTLAQTNDNIWSRCKNQCTIDNRKHSGVGVPFNHNIFNICAYKCGAEYHYIPKAHVKVIVILI